MADDKKFTNWIVSQIRLAGEELIRRADQMSFDGWDCVTNLKITMDIPSYKASIELPTIKFSIEGLSKCTIDDIIAGGNAYATEDSRTNNGHRVGDILSNVDDKTEN